MAIRAATPDDVGALASIQFEAATLAYAGIFDAADAAPTPQRIALRWATLLARPRSWVGLLEVDGGPAGAIALQPSPDFDLDGAEVAEVCSFYVLPRHWGRRLGRPLFERALAEADAFGYRDVRLWVLEANVRARRIYEAGGWLADGAERPVPGVAASTATATSAAGVFERRYRRTDGALAVAAVASSVRAIEIDDVYDPETLARIEAAGPAEPAERPRPVRRVRQRGAAGVLAAAMMMGLREVFDPPQHSEIEQVDPWEGGGTNPRVRVHLDPDPRQTIAEVRDL